MAEKEFKYLLEFQSVATGNGAKQTVDDLKKVEQGAASLTVKQADLRAEFSGVSDRFDATKTAYYDLNKAAEKSTAGTAAFTAGTTAVKKGTTDASRSLLMFSQGFEDAQYGIRGVLNNIPGLVIALGGTAGLAGAISIAAVSFSVLFEWLEKTEEKASDVADRIKEIADNMGAAEVDRFDAVGDSIDAAAAATAALKQGWDESRKAEEQFSTAALTNAEKLAIAQRNIAEALGLQVNHFQELEVIAQREAAARNLAAQQAIQTEQTRKQKAVSDVTVAADALSQAKQRADIEKANLVQLRGELEALRQKRDELTKTAAIRADLGAALSGEALFPGQNNDPNALAAQAKLADPAFQQKLAGTQARVDKLEESLRKLTDENTGTVGRLENSLNQAQAKQADISQAVDTNIQRITETLNADTLVAKSGELVKTGELLAKDIQDSFGKIETTNALGLVAKGHIEAAAADGKIAADEMAGTTADLRTLMGLIQSGQASFAGNVQSLIAVQQEFVGVASGIKSDISSLQGQMNTLKTQVGTIGRTR